MSSLSAMTWPFRIAFMLASSMNKRSGELWPLGQLGAGCDARGRRLQHIAELHPVRRQHRSDAIAVVVDQVDRTGARHDGDDLLAAPCRRKRAGEPAAVLLVDGHGERDAVKSRLGRRLGAMMGIAAAQDDRFALAGPGAAQIG